MGRRLTAVAALSNTDESSLGPDACVVVAASMGDAASVTANACVSLDLVFAIVQKQEGSRGEAMA